MGSEIDNYDDIIKLIKKLFLTSVSFRCIFLLNNSASTLNIKRFELASIFFNSFC